MSSFRYPYFYLQLPACQCLSQEGSRDCRPECDTGQACHFTSSAEIFEDRLGVIDVLGDIERICPMRAVEVFIASFPEEQPDGAITVGRLRGKLVKERDETGIEGICLFN
jgi:hypothetical protein